MSTNVEKPKKSLFTVKKETTSEKKPKPEKAVKGKKASAEKKQKAPKQKEWKELETAQHPQQDRCMFPGAYCVYGDHRCVSIPEIRRRIKREIHRFHITDDAYGHGKSEYEL